MELLSSLSCNALEGPGVWGEFSSPPQIFEILGTSTAWEVVFSQGDDDDDGGIMTYDYYCLGLCHILCYTLPHLISP